MKYGPALVGMGVAYAASYYLGRTWGATCEERRRELPGGAVVPDARFGGNHAISIAARPADVWPWLVQMGWGRGGWYTHRWVDRLLFPHNGPSAEVVLPQFQDLKAGDVIPDGPPELNCYFVVEALEPQRHIILHSTTHLPPQLQHRSGVGIDWTWGFYLTPEASGSTRFHFRWRATAHPHLLRVALDALITPLDFVMGRSMCKGIKRRAEQFSQSIVNAAPITVLEAESKYSDVGSKRS